MSIENMREYLTKKYPSGVMKGRKIADMPTSQVVAVYNSVLNYQRKEKQIKGQTCLFD